MRRQLDSLVKKRLVGDNAVGFMPAGRADNHLRGGVVDPLRQFGRREAPEHHRMDCAKPRAAQHRDNRLGDHRHIDDHPVTCLHAETLQHAGEAGGGLLKLGIGQRRGVAGDRRVIDDRLLIAAPGRHMAVNRVMAGVHLGIWKPAMEGRP